MRLSTRSNWILWALATKTRMLTAEQIARWLGITQPRAESLAAALVAARLVEQKRVRAQLLGPLQKPLLRQRANDKVGNAGRISWLAKKRYAGVPTREVTVYVASPKCGAIYGLPPRQRLKLEHASHDIGCGEMFLYAMRRWPLLTSRYYQMEDVYAAERADVKFAKVEDARLFRNGQTLMVFEYAGRYSTERVRSFVNDMNARQLSFFLM